MCRGERERVTRRDEEGNHLDDHHAIQFARALGKLEHFDAGERPKEDWAPRGRVEVQGGGEEARRRRERRRREGRGRHQIKD